MKYKWDCYNGSTVRCLDCPSAGGEDIINSAYTSDRSYTILASPVNSAYFGTGSSVKIDTATAKCPVLYNLEYLNTADNNWVTVSSGTPTWVNGVQNAQASNATFRINTNNMSMHGLSIPMRYTYTIRSDPTLVAYDQFAVTFTNGCATFAITKKAGITDPVVLTIAQGASWNHVWGNYWNDMTSCPWDSLFEKLNPATQAWVPSIASNLAELSAYASTAEKNWTLNGLGSGTNDQALKTNPALNSQYRFSFISTDSLSVNKQDTLYFSVTYTWDCFTASTVRCLKCPATDAELAASISGS